ncbi:hypothetical protein M3Y98_00810600 [Aphelenchoides besseyi]|nr:hypothetical protein M3Y98_00810600 [Aphelenchoides besseyi]
MQPPFIASTSNSSNDAHSSWSPSSLSDFLDHSPPSPAFNNRRFNLPLVSSDTTVASNKRHREVNRCRRMERVSAKSPSRRNQHNLRTNHFQNFEEGRMERKREYPKTPRHSHRRRRRTNSKPPKFEKFTITIPMETINPSPPPTTDYGTGSDENRIDQLDDSDEENYDEAATDFMNATEKIYENLRLSKAPVVYAPSVPPPTSIRDDEASLYGRLTALLLANSMGRLDRISQVESGVRSLLQIHTLGLRLSEIKDEQTFARSAAIFGMCSKDICQFIRGLICEEKMPLGIIALFDIAPVKPLSVFDGKWSNRWQIIGVCNLPTSTDKFDLRGPRRQAAKSVGHSRI